MVSVWIDQHRHEITLGDKKWNILVLFSQVFQIFLNTYKRINDKKHIWIIKSQGISILKMKFRDHRLAAGDSSNRFLVVLL